MDSTIIVAIIAAFSGAAIAAVITGLFTRPKTRAEVKSLEDEIQNRMIGRYDVWIRQLEERLTATETELEKQKKLTQVLVGYTKDLRSTIISIGGTPPPVPPEIAPFILH